MASVPVEWSRYRLLPTVLDHVCVCVCVCVCICVSVCVWGKYISCHTCMWMVYDLKGTYVLYAGRKCYTYLLNILSSRQYCYVLLEGLENGIQCLAIFPFMMYLRREISCYYTRILFMHESIRRRYLQKIR